MCSDARGATGSDSACGSFLSAGIKGFALLRFATALRVTPTPIQLNACHGQNGLIRLVHGQDGSTSWLTVFDMVL